jgi:hypothetical protein
MSCNRIRIGYDIIIVIWQKEDIMKNREKLVITETQPTSIVKDFMIFSEYLDSHEVLLTKAQGWLPRKDLLVINALMTEPEQEVTAYSRLPADDLVLLSGAGSKAVPDRTASKRQANSAPYGTADDFL